MGYRLPDIKSIQVKSNSSSEGLDFAGAESNQPAAESAEGGSGTAGAGGNLPGAGGGTGGGGTGGGGGFRGGGGGRAGSGPGGAYTDGGIGIDYDAVQEYNSDLAARARNTIRNVSDFPNRGRSATESAAPPEVETTANNDGITLPSSSRDTALKEYHGLTSLYPVVLLTTPVQDYGDVETIIDVNLSVKNAIEIDTSIAIRTVTPEIEGSLTAAGEKTPYIVKMAEATAYLDESFKAASKKDNLFYYMNVINLPSSNTADGGIERAQRSSLAFSPENSDFDYTLFAGESTKNYLDRYAGATSLGTNTQNLLQVFKSLTYHVACGTISNVYITNQSSAVTQPDAILEGQLLGEITPYAEQIRNVLSIVPVSSLDRIDIDFATANYSINNSLPDVFRFINRDLILHKKSQNISTTTEQYQAINAIQQIVGNYGAVSQLLQSSDTNYIETVNDFIENTTAPDSKNLLVKTDDQNAKLLALDFDNKFGTSTSTGADYLIYDGLRATTAPDENIFSNLTSFVNDYKNVATKLNSLYRKIYPSEEEILKFATIAFGAIGTFINTLKLAATSTRASQKSMIRFHAFIAATQSPSIERQLFEFMCALDKLEHGEITQAAFNTIAGTSGSPFLTSISRENGNEYDNDPVAGLDPGSSSDITYSDPYSTSVNFSDLSSSPAYQAFYVDSDRYELSFIHNAVRSAENFYLGEVGTSSTATNWSNRRTSRSYSVTRDARAFVLYQIFLSLLRTVNFSVRNRDASSRVFSWRPPQFESMRLAVTNVSNTSQSEASAYFQTYFSGRSDSLANNATFYHSNYVLPFTTRMIETEQRCLDFVNIVGVHAYYLSNLSTDINRSVYTIQRAAQTRNVFDNESFAHAVQTEQVRLKKNNLVQHGKFSSACPYLPAYDSCSVGQIQNLKTCIKSGLFGDDNTLTHLISIGLPSGLLESLRYKDDNTAFSHFFEVVIVRKNLQVQEAKDVSFADRPSEFIEKSYKFSTRLFIDEGSADFGGADTVSSSLTNLSAIARATNFGTIDDTGIYSKIDYSNAIRIFGSAVVENHIKSYYANLYLRATSGVDTREQYLTMIPQTIRYPDADRLDLYSTYADVIDSQHPNVTQAQFAQKLKYDAARSISVSANQHFKNVILSKTFEKIVNIIIDENQFDPNFSFENISAYVRLAN